MCADITPEGLPDESLYSLVARLGIINGYNPETTCRILLGNKHELRVADAEINLPLFIASTDNLYGNSIDILQKHTNYPFRHMIATPLLDGENSNKWIRYLLNPKLNLAELSNHEKHVWRWCPQCLELDFEFIGFTYWRRKHQLPGVFVCADHHSSLQEVTIPFGRRQKNFYFPNTLPLDIEKYILCTKNTNYDLAIKLSKISEGILNCANLNINQHAFRQTIKNGLTINGLITKSSVIRKETSKVFERFYESLKEIKGVSLLTKSHIFEKQLRALLNNSEITLNKPLIFPMLILWLYGEWELFQNAYEWEVTMSTGVENFEVQPIKSKPYSNKPFRELCKLFILENPNSLRKDFYKLHPRPYIWLRNYDSEWFEKTLPSPTSHKPRQLHLFKNKAHVNIK